MQHVVSLYGKRQSIPGHDEGARKHYKLERKGIHAASDHARNLDQRQMGQVTVKRSGVPALGFCMILMQCYMWFHCME